MEKTQNYLIAYLDLLGAKDRIKNDRDDFFLNLLSDCYKQTKMALNTFMPLSGIEDYRVKIFSDNIVIAIPSDVSMLDNHHPVIALNRIETAVCFFQRVLLERKFLLRGGVSFGPLFIDDVFVWGKSLIDAISIESNIAKYPRVVVDKRILEFRNLFYLEDLSLSNISTMNIRKDTDGEFFFDYLNYPNDPGVCKLVDSSLTEINERIKSEDDQRKLEKIVWHRDYLLLCKAEKQKLLSK